MNRHLRHNHFQCWPHRPFKEMTMGRAVGLADEHVRMQPRLAFLLHNIAGEREHLDLFLDWNLL